MQIFLHIVVFRVTSLQRYTGCLSIQRNGQSKQKPTNARIAYGDRNISFPVPVQVRWAGRTPVITLDSVTIPPLGTFDARGLMRRGSYAGTWSHGKKGGHLFGKYLKTEAVKDENK